MTVFHTTPLQRLSQAELRLPFALMRPGNLSFSWKSYAEQVGFHRPSEHCVNPCINVSHRANSYAQCLVINTGTPVQKLQLYNWQLHQYQVFVISTWQHLLILFMNTIHLTTNRYIKNMKILQNSVTSQLKKSKSTA